MNQHSKAIHRLVSSTKQLSVRLTARKWPVNEAAKPVIMRFVPDNMKPNPLTVPICQILRASPQGLSEYALLTRLQFEGVDFSLDESGLDDRASGDRHDAELLLFRKHFLVMNALYQLQPVLWEEGLYLRVSALLVKLETVVLESEVLESTGLEHIEKGLGEELANSDYLADHNCLTLPCPAGEQAIREYYLDWREFEQSSSESVKQLLDSFWQRYYAEDQQQHALEQLQLAAECSWLQIRDAYRRLAAIHHPDKGGDSDRFRQIREAYELLACCRR